MSPNRGVKMRVWLIITFVCFSFGLKPVNPVFHRLTTEDGLSSAYVTSILQDRKGYIWIGTSEGLNRYDGISFQTFRPEKGNPASIQGNTIEKLFEDDAGYIWIYFSSGEISYYDPVTGLFTNYTKEWLRQQVRVYGKVLCFSSAVPSQTWIGTENGLLVFTHATRALGRMRNGNPAVYNAPVNCIYQATSRMVLLGTPDGFSLYNSFRKDFTDYPLQVEEEGRIETRQLPGINCMYRDRAGYFWIGTEKTGAYRTVKPNDDLVFHPVGEPDLRIYQFAETADGNFWIGHNKGASLIRGDNRSTLVLEDLFTHPEDTGGEQIHVKGMIKDKDGNIWFQDNRFDQGQFFFSTESQQIGQLTHIPEYPYSIGSNLITCIHIDRLNNLWLGHENYGLSFGSLNPLPFTYTFGYTTDSLSLSANQVLAVYEDSFRNLWVATIGGLDRINSRTGEIDKRFVYAPYNRAGSLSGKRIGSLAEDKEYNLWITYHDAFPDRINLETWEKQRFIPESQGMATLSIPKALRDKDGNIWLSTLGKGLLYYDPENDRTVTYPEPVISSLDRDLSYPELYSMCIDNDGEIWTGIAGKGVRSFNPETGQYQDYVSDPADSTGLLSDYVHTIYCDSMGTLWIGTNAGMNRLNKTTGIFEHYTTEQNLAGNIVQSICEADSGILYIGTNKGLSRLNIPTGEIMNFTTANGFLTNEFLPDAVCRLSSGVIVMGTNKGIVSFSPAVISHVREVNDLALVRIRPDLQEELSPDFEWRRYYRHISGGILLCLFALILGVYIKRKKNISPEVVLPVRENTTEEISLSCETVLSDAEQEFVNRATQVVLENLQDPGFDVDRFCSLMAMSRANLFRKLKATTGFSASAFTRHIRMEQAAKMLRQKDYTINEVATRVGFSDPNYFSRCFKEEYGVSPSGYE